MMPPEAETNPKSIKFTINGNTNSLPMHCCIQKISASNRPPHSPITNGWATRTITALLRWTFILRKPIQFNNRQIIDVPINPIDTPYMPIIIILVANDTNCAAILAVGGLEITLGPLFRNTGTKGTVIPSKSANIQTKCQEKFTLIIKYRPCINLLPHLLDLAYSLGIPVVDGDTTYGAPCANRRANSRSTAALTGGLAKVCPHFGKSPSPRSMNSNLCPIEPRTQHGTAPCRRKRLLVPAERKRLRRHAVSAVVGYQG